MIELPFRVPRPVMVFGIAVAVVFIHELGHYVIGRWLVGIPASDMKIVMTKFPAHVALRDGQTWVSPSEHQYYQLYRQYDPDFNHSAAYSGGGLITQTIGAVGIGGILLAAGRPEVAEAFIEVSILLAAINLVIDGGHIIFRRTSGGDFWGLWRSSPIATIAVLIVFAVPHGALYLSV